MIQKYAKRSDENLVMLAKLANTGLKEAYVAEKTSGLPNKFKVPMPIVPKLKKIKLMKGGRI